MLEGFGPPPTVSWRNLRPHGHCVDRTTKTLRHNHLIHPDDYPGGKCFVLNAATVGAFLRLVRFLPTKSAKILPRNEKEETSSMFGSALQKISWIPL